MVPAMYIDLDGQVKAKEPVDPECPTNSGNGLGQKERGIRKFIRPYP